MPSCEKAPACSEATERCSSPQPQLGSALESRGLGAGQRVKGPPSGHACLPIFPAEAPQTGAPGLDAEPRLPEDNAVVVLSHRVRGSLVSQ